MQTNPSFARYNPILIAMHWFMLLLLVAVYLCMELSGNFPRGSDMRSALRTWHYMLGLSVFVLVWIRLAFKLHTNRPPITPRPAQWQEHASSLLQWAFYAFMIFMPLLGWLTLSANGQPIPFFGLYLPALVSENKELAHTIRDLHETGATIGYFMLAGHAAAALFHHYFLRDDTLRRMLPTKD